jgi:class 3 adenylate cyclase
VRARVRRHEAMTTLRTTVIMKTDISGSTVRFRALAEADLHALLIEHREFLSRHAVAHDGRIVKPEGDGFWLVFPSVTAAALAAMAMQEELRLAQPNKGDDRLAMRVVITLGDVLHEEGALVGDTVVLTARIESITPPDEIYLSAAACLAVNEAEIRTAFVDTFPLKGFSESVSVYRLEQTHRTRVIANQYIVVADLRNFSRIMETAPMTTIEKVLEALFGLVNRVAREFSGTVRFSVGDAYYLTFADTSLAMAAAEGLSENWDAFLHQEKLSCPINVAVHRGTLYAFRSYLYGPGINVASRVESASGAVLAPNEGSIFVTGEVRSHLAGTVWGARLDLIDVRPRGHAEIEIYRLGKMASDSNCP